MPLTIEYLETAKCFVLHWDGHFDADMARAGFRDVASKEWFRPGLNILHDFRMADPVMSRDDVITLSIFRDTVTFAFGEPKVAFVLPEQNPTHWVRDFVDGRDRNVAGWSTLVTTDFAEARAWLGISDDKGLD